MPDPADAAERRRIEQATGETLFVEAGAGTGKTTGLVGRILSLVREGIAIDAIAAITFTEKAASELSERVRKQLEEEVSRVSGETRERYAQAIRDLDQAAIQTLHSFAMRILTLYPLEAGLPPRLALRDDVEATLAFNDRWQRFQDALLDNPALETALLRGLTIGLRLRDLQEVADRFSESWERLEDLDFPTAAMPSLAPSEVYGPIDEVQRMRRDSNSDGLSRKLDDLAGYVGFLRDLDGRLNSASSPTERASLEVDLLRLLAKMPVITTSTSGRSKGSRAGNRLAGCSRCSGGDARVRIRAPPHARWHARRLHLRRAPLHRRIRAHGRGRAPPPRRAGVPRLCWSWPAICCVTTPRSAWRCIGASSES
jgi:hypothetical protein